jgi:hypothetical protein
METLADVNEKDREISLQFSFMNLAAIPQFLEDLPEESTEDATDRRQLNNKATGVDLTNGGQFRGKMIDLRRLPADILRTDYELVGVWKQKRLQTKKGWGENRPYWMIRFRFCNQDHLTEYRAKMGEQAWQAMVEKRPMLLGELVTICSLSFWQMRAYRNPWFQNGNLLPGVHFISLNFEGRQPLYEWDSPKSLGDDDLPPQFKPNAVFKIA